MDQQQQAGRAFLVPVAVAIGVFAALSSLWNHPTLALHDVVPHALPVYLGGSFVALLLLWWFVPRLGLSARDLGLDPAGWTAPSRLAGLGLILLMGYGGYYTLPEPPPPQSPESLLCDEVPPGADAAAPVLPQQKSFADYCFWFVFLLAASLAELLVFASIGFCVTERYLRQRGLEPARAGILAALFTSIAFGLYHYTYEPRWWDYALFPLIPVMLINLLYFGLTRNFQLTLVLHNAFAAVGFTQEQYRTTPPELMVNPDTYRGFNGMAPVLTAFILPYLLLHLLEFHWRRREAGTSK